MPDEMKECVTCGRLLPVSHFYIQGSGKRRNQYHDCRMEKNREWANNNIGKMRKSRREYARKLRGEAKDYVRGEPAVDMTRKPLPDLEIGQRYRIKVSGITKPFVGIVTARYGANWFMQTENDGPHSFTPAQLVGAWIEKLEREAVALAS